MTEHPQGARAPLDAATIPAELGVLLRRRFDAVDAMDLDALLALHSPDGRLIFGARPPVVGRKAAAEQIRAFWSQIAGLRHNLVRVSAVGTLAFVESLIDYERLDGRVVTVACCDVFTVRDGLIVETRAYLDQSAVFADASTDTEEGTA